MRGWHGLCAEWNALYHHCRDSTAVAGGRWNAPAYAGWSWRWDYQCGLCAHWSTAGRRGRLGVERRAADPTVGFHRWDDAARAASRAFRSDLQPGLFAGW